MARWISSDGRRRPGSPRLPAGPGRSRRPLGLDIVDRPARSARATSRCRTTSPSPFSSDAAPLIGHHSTRAMSRIRTGVPPSQTTSSRCRPSRANSPARDHELGLGHLHHVRPPTSRLEYGSPRDTFISGMPKLRRLERIDRHRYWSARSRRCSPPRPRPAPWSSW